MRDTLAFPKYLIDDAAPWWSRGLMYELGRQVSVSPRE